MPPLFTKNQTILLVLGAMMVTWIGFSIQLRYTGVPAQPGANNAQTPSGLPTAPKPIDFPTYSVMGTVKAVSSGLLKVEVTGFSEPGVTEIREIVVTGSTKITRLVPPQPTDEKPSTEPPQLPKGTPISLSDIKVGNTVSASSGTLDIQRKMKFTAVSIMKIVEE